MPHATRERRLAYGQAYRHRPPPADWQPECMEPDDHLDWRALNARVSGPGRAVLPCEDCPLTFALEMRADGRCNGEPGGSGASWAVDRPTTARRGGRATIGASQTG